MEEKGQRLSKVLSAAGVASRRACEKIIFNGHVRVNGIVVIRPQTLVTPNDVIFLDNKRIGSTEQKVTYILNKPLGYVCSNAKGRYDNIVIDLFRWCPVRLFPVGRLDKDTKGLLLVSNDGHLANSIIHPRYDIEKEYLAIVHRDIHKEDLKVMMKGAYIHGTYVSPVNIMKRHKNAYSIIVKEGKKHEVRILAKLAGFKVKELTRIRIGPLTLGKLQPGEWREMMKYEKQLMLSSHPQTVSL